MGQTYDAVVIGSGPNGLAAAIRLAEHGRAVLLVEARDRLGGAVATQELTLPGFHHDTYSAVYPAGAASPVFRRLPLEQYGLRWVHPPVAMAHPLPDGRAAALYQDLDRTAQNLDAVAPRAGQGWRDFIAPYVEHFEALRHTMLGGFPPLGGGLRLLAGLGIGGSLEFARVLLLPAKELARELFGADEEAATAWLYGSSLHGDVPPWEAGSAITAVYLNLLGHGVGWPSPEGGAGRLAAALAGYLHARGGQPRVGTPVERVLTRGGRVRGVVAGGEEVRAGIVVGDVTPHGLLRLAGDALPAAYAARLRRYRYGDGAFKVDWALDGPIPWTAAEARQAGTVHVGGTAAEIDLATGEQRAGALPERPFMLLGQQSLADPTRAPAGKHTAWAYTHVPDRVDWARAREDFVERMEAHVERYAPGFRDRILARHVLTPGDFERHNRNLIGGDVGGGSYALDQLVFRPISSLFPYRTPIRGLYIGSAATFPGGAVHGVGGDAAARLALLESHIPRLR